MTASLTTNQFHARLKRTQANASTFKVYFSENVNESWNGYFKGELLAPQVLDYYLEIKCIGEKILFEKGNITIIR